MEGRHLLEDALAVGTGLQQQHAEAGLGQPRGQRTAAGTGTDNDVVVVHASSPAGNLVGNLSTI